MAKKTTLISLDIGSRELKAVAGTLTDGKLKVAAMKTVSMPPDIYNNGLILDETELRKVLSELLRSLKFKTKNVAVAFESNDVIKREILVPAVAAGDLSDLVRYEITDYLPIDIDSYVMQHRVIGTAEDGKQRVMVAAIPDSTVGGFFRLISAAGFSPMLMDLKSNGIETLVSKSGQFLDGNYAFIDIGARFLNVLLFENGKFVFNRIISMGMQIFDAPLAKLAGSSILHEFGLTGMWLAYRSGGLVDRDMSMEHRYALDEVVLCMDQLLDEIDKVFKFYISREPRSAIHRIRIFGGGALVHSMNDVFERKFEIHTSVLELSDFVTVTPAHENALYINAASIMLGGL